MEAAPPAGPGCSRTRLERCGRAAPGDQGPQHAADHRGRRTAGQGVLFVRVRALFTHFLMIKTNTMLSVFL